MTKNKQIIIVFNIIAAVFVLGMLAIIFSSCNPVKQVLRDEYKMRKVWNEGALDGWCVNDTTIVNKSDTSYLFDTIYKIETETLIKDSLINLVTTKVKYVTKTIRITDTFTNIVTDNSRIELLQRQLNISNDEGLKLSRENDTLKTAANGFKSERNKWRLRFFLLLTAFGLFLFRKPLWKLATNIILPVKF